MVPAPSFFVEVPKLVAVVSEKTPKEGRRVLGDADDLVRRLPIELEVELRLGAAVVPVETKLELLPPQPPLRPRDPSDRDIDARGLPRDPAFPGDRRLRRDDAARDESGAAFVLAREHEDRVALRDMFAAIHRLLRSEHEGVRRRICNLRLDREDTPLNHALTACVVVSRWTVVAEQSCRLRHLRLFR